MDGDDDVSTYQRLKLTGEIDLTLAGTQTHLTGMEVRHEDGAWRARLDGPLGELRKLARAAPAFAPTLALVASEPDDASANLRLRASDDLARELDAAIPLDLLPDEWLRREDVATLLFALARWSPESVGIVTRL